MSFTNPAIDPDLLPRADELEWTDLPIEHRREVRLQSLITVTLLMAVAWLLGAVIPFPPALEMPVSLLPVAVLVIGGGISVLIQKKIKHKGYALRAHDIAYRSGLFWRTVVVLPFNRIQHVEVSSGPLQRRFGLATLKFYTAGGASVDLRIGGLLSSDAERLRTHILKRSGAEPDRTEVPA